MNSRSKPEEMSTTYLQDSLIWSPILNHVYRIPYQQKNITILFQGDNNIKYFNLSSGALRTHHATETNFEYFITKDSLPQSYRMQSLPPVMFIDKNECRPDQLKTILTVKSITLKSNSNNYSLDLSCDPSNTFIQSYNQELQIQYQKFSKEIPVTTGKYPIFLDENRPNYAYLEKLYKNFLRFNKIDKLTFQYENSKDNCHVRAEVLNRFFGIPAVKVYKFWNPIEWKKYVKNKSWYFHCAIMFIDQDKQGWICDSWVGFNKKLLTLKEWMYRSDEPTPIKIMITNPAVINDVSDGKEINSPHFLRISSDEQMNAFQAVATSAFPNHPEKILSISTHHFFNVAKNKVNKMIAFEKNKTKSNNLPTSNRFYHFQKQLKNINELMSITRCTIL